MQQPSSEFQVPMDWRACRPPTKLNLVPLLALLLFSAWGVQRCLGMQFADPAQLRKLLYYAEADNTGIYQPTNAAFRYKQLLYVIETGKPRANFTNMANLYGPAERERANAVAELVLGKVVSSSQNDAAYGPLLLDVYYDRAAAEVILAQNLLDEARTAHYGPPLFTALPPPPSGFVIDNEIQLHEAVVALYRSVVSNYFTLFTLTRPALNPPNPPRTENPGAQIFMDLVPSRGLLPATYQSNGTPVSVTASNTPLFNGYKDLVLLNGLLRDYSRAAETLARLYIARGEPDDPPAAKALVTQAERTVYLQGTLLRGLFPNLDPVSVANSGLAESQAAWEKALSALDQLKQLLDGSANVLGFASDFLMLIQGTNHSFNVFKDHLNVSVSTSPLKLAVEALATARGSYAAYRGFQDQLQTQLDAVTGRAEDRLFQILGRFPPYEGDYTPLPGSEVALQESSIEVARLRVQRNHNAISNLNEEVAIETERVGREQGIHNAIGSIRVTYAGKQAKLTEEISYISAAQAAANELAASASAAGELKFLGAGAHGVNAFLQAGAEVGKGLLAAKKERLAAAETMEITAQDNLLLSLNSKALVKTKLLAMKQLELDSEEASIELSQEQGRLVALARETAHLEATLAESDASLSSRYFADPVHRLTAQSDLVRADLAFAEAQKWLFFMQRALEYKWSRGMTNFSYLGRSWSSSSVFKLRNADELLDYFNALVAFEFPIEGTIPGAKTVLYDWFSVREHFFGLIAGATYMDPASGQPVDATNAFRARLRGLVRTNSSTSQEINLRFSTVRQIPGGSFFQGPTFNGTNVIPGALGTYVDKIQTIKIRLVGGNFTVNSIPINNARLTYGGSSIMRRQRVGTFDPARPDRLRNEMIAQSTRYYYNEGDGWKFVEALTIPFISLEKSPDPLAPPNAGLTPEFAERSVAATGWQLDIPLVDLGTEVLSISDLDDIRIYFVHSSRTRLQ